MNARFGVLAGLALASVVAVGCTQKPKAQPQVLDVKGAYNPGALDGAAPQPVPSTPPETLDPRAHPAGVEPLAPSSATPGPRTYTVKKGDTLFNIAKNQYGNGNQYLRIVEANPGLTPTKMRVGQEIVLP